ncbi:MAG TPA: VWA domain-containing protein [Thermoanaerobaculia bacterium]|nr:VWA domain-containing protein [Thermoanaerobaculia bacterium]
MKRPLVLLLLLSLLSLAPGIRAADDTPPSFGESIDVRVVNVEAVVTDRQGNRVSGLKPEDFRLRVDGREVPVEYFSEVREGEALAATSEAVPPPAAQPEAPRPEAKAGGAAVPGLAEGRVGTYYLLFIDDFFSIPAQRNAVLQGLKADLGRLGPDDRMAIVAYNGGRLTMLSNWSGSAADLARAFDQAMARRTRSLGRLAERNSAENEQDFSAQSVGDGAPLDLSAQQPGLSDIQRRYASDLIRQVRGDVQAAVSALRAFAAPRGRKVMLLLSGGWPFSIQSYASQGAGMPTKELPEGEELYRPLTNTANLLGYTLYPVDVPGIQSGAADVNAPPPPTSGDPAPERGLANVVAGGGQLVPQSLLLGGYGNLSEHEIEGSLKYLAQETGGKAILNTNRGLALALARDDTRSFYWLGFSPSWKHDDKGHRIELETRRKGLKVRTRSGFLDLSRKAAVTMTVESALLFGNPPGALAMPLKVGEVVRSKRGEFEIPITLSLPVDLMTVVPDGKRFTVQLELRFAASSANGDTADIPVVPVTLTSDHQPAPGKLVKYETRVKLLGKANHMVVAAYDPLSGKIATAETDLKVP